MNLSDARRILSEMDDTIKQTSRSMFDWLRNEEETEEDRKKKRTPVNKWFDTVNWREKKIEQEME